MEDRGGHFYFPIAGIYEDVEEEIERGIARRKKAGYNNEFYNFGVSGLGFAEVRIGIRVKEIPIKRLRWMYNPQAASVLETEIHQRLIKHLRQQGYGLFVHPRDAFEIVWED